MKNEQTYISIVANLVPVTSGNVQRRKLNDSTITHLIQFVSDFELADNIPVDTESL